MQRAPQLKEMCSSLATAHNKRYSSIMTGDFNAACIANDSLKLVSIAGNGKPEGLGQNLHTDAAFGSSVMRRPFAMSG
jgi:hypothetical protein